MWTLAWPWMLMALPLPLLVRRYLPASQETNESGLKVPNFDIFSASLKVLVLGFLLTPPRFEDFSTILMNSLLRKSSIHVDHLKNGIPILVAFSFRFI